MSYQNLQPTHGVGSPVWDEEFEAMLGARKELWDELQTRMNLRDSLAPEFPGVSKDGLLGIADAIAAGSRMRDLQNPRAMAMRRGELNDLQGRADNYGIDTAGKDPGEIYQEILARRVSQRANLDAEDGQMNDSDLAAALGIGGAKSIARVLQTLPWAGDIIAKTRAMQDVDQWLSKIDEGYIADMWEESEKGVKVGELDLGILGEYNVRVGGYNQAKFLGGMLTYAIPASLAWKAAGALTGARGVTAIGGTITSVNGRVSPIAKMALKGKDLASARLAGMRQGLVASAMLESGGDAPWQERLAAVALGGAFGAGEVQLLNMWRARVEGLAARTRKSFPRGEDMGDMGQWQDDVTAEGEWGFEGDEGGSLAPARQRLGPGPAGDMATPPRESLPPFIPEALPSGPDTGGFLAPGQYDVGQVRSIVTPSVHPTMGPITTPPPASMFRNLTIRQDKYFGSVEIDTDVETATGLLNFNGYVDRQGTLHVSSLFPKRAAEVPVYNWTEAGPTYTPVLSPKLGIKGIRRLGQQLMEELRGQGVEVNQIVGHRVSGARHGPAADPERRFHSEEEEFDAATQVYADPQEMRIKAAGVKTKLRQETIDDAVQLNKQATIMESPALAQLAPQSSFDDADVIQAAMATNPGQINVIRNVGDMAVTLRRMAQAVSEQRLMPHTFRVIEHADIEPPHEAGGRNFPMPRTLLRYDILVSDGLPITPRRVEQYRQYGIFEGQRVTTQEGVEGVVESLGHNEGEIVQIRNANARHSYRVFLSELTAGRTTHSGLETGTADVEMAYEDMRLTVLNEMSEETTRAGIRNPDWLDFETSSQLPRMIENFLDARGVRSPVSRSVYTNYFNARRVEDYRSATPRELMDQLEQLHVEVADEVFEAREAGRLITTLDEVAETNGFDVRVAGDRLNIADTRSDVIQTVDDEAEALGFLRTIEREVPDVIDAGNIPDELFEHVVGAPTPAGSRVPPHGWEGELDVEDDIADIFEEELDDLFEEFRMLGEDEFPGPGSSVAQTYDLYSGGGPVGRGFIREQGGTGWTGSAGAGGFNPPPPRPPFVGGPAFPESPDPFRLPPGSREIGGRFKRRGVAHATLVDQRMNSFFLRWMTPIRNSFIDLDNFLQDTGMGRVNLAQMYEGVSNNNTIAKSGANVLAHEADGFLSSFSDRKFIRDGTIFNLMGVRDRVAKEAMMATQGYTPADVEAQDGLEAFLGRMFADAAGDPNYAPGDVSSFADYILGVRGRQLENLEDVFADFKHSLPRHLKFLEDEIRSANIDYRELNANKVVHRLIRSVMFAKHVKPHWEQMAAVWTNQDIPPALKSFVDGYLQIVRYGRNPADDGMITATRYMLNKMGIPAQNGDVASIFGGAVGTMFRSILGGKIAPIFRESFQPFMVWIKHGNAPIASTYADWFKGGATRKEMVDEAIANGWTEPGRPSITFSDTFEDAPFESEVMGSMTPEQRAGYRPDILAKMDSQRRKREMWARGVDAIWNMMPKTARLGYQDTMIDPLLWYGKTTSTGKVVAGVATRRMASAEIAAYRVGDMNLNQLHTQLGTRFYTRTLIDEVSDLLENGDDYGAAKRLASEVVADAMVRTGSSEQAAGIRESGVAGRGMMVLGNFSLAQLHFIRGIKQAPWQEGVNAATRYGIIAAVLAGASAATGIKFERMQWHRSLLFSGSPPVRLLAKAVTAVGGAMGMAQGYEPSSGESEAMRGFSPGAVAGGLASTFNIYHGLGQSVTGYMEASQTDSPFYFGSRFALSGERPGAAQTSDMNNWLYNNSPVNGTGGFGPPPSVREQMNPPFLDDSQGVPVSYTPTSPGAGAF